ncbi:MAG: sigma-54-dependent Fis family transcriptional regulator [Desulfobacterales bacterium]|nr:sigma-54-dependent Fis family transcriptional regulator [Desulfobacterales bacterium]
MGKILIIDDDESLCDMLFRNLRYMGHSAAYAFTLEDGLRKASTGTFHVVFLDVRMPDGNGLDILPKIKEAPSSPEVIIMTGFGDPDGAELAIKSGAWDYIQKPFSMEKFKLPLLRALQYREARKAEMVPVALNLDGVVGSSPQMRTCFDLLAQAAHSDVSVLIIGETGVGKEVFASAIHNNSRRAGKNFVVVDCAALPETIVESVLFGHEKGAFTGADKAREGLIKQADGGTLFLDEVGELPMSVQRAFLRVLQERRFRPVGGKREIESDFRLVGATNKNLDKMVQSGRFRQDLLFRLRAFTIRLPPLRERPQDIGQLLMYHTTKLCKSYGIETKGFSPEFLATLTMYDWPGNVREFINALETALAKAPNDPTLFPKHLPSRIRIKAARTSVSKEPSANVRLTTNPDPYPGLPKMRDVRDAALSEVEQRYLQDLFSFTGGDIKQACEISGLSRARLYQLLKKYNMSKPG